MGERRGRALETAEATVRPILGELGLELVEASVTGPGRTPTLRLLVDRPAGGITTDELQAASREIERALEVADLFPGRYLLEVSSPGLDRPWRSLRDFERHVGARAQLTLAAPLPDGRRSLRGRLVGVAGGELLFEPDGGGEALTIPLAGVVRAIPEIDWAALLKGRSPGAGPGGAGGAP